MNIKTVTKEQMLMILSESRSMREVIIKFGLSSNGSGGYRNIKKKIQDFGIEIPKFNYYGYGGNQSKKHNDEIFIKNSTYSRSSLKKRILNENLLKYSCEICNNNGKHMGKKLSLHIDHKNGINDDNRLENLRFLCPNCHSQTSTYGGKSNKKNKKSEKTNFCKCGSEIYKTSDKCLKCSRFNQRKVVRPSINQLMDDIKKMGYLGTGRKYGVSDNAIRKWIKNAP